MKQNPEIKLSIQQRTLSLAKRMMQSKRELQQEIREDIHKPEIREAIEELKKRNEKR